MPAICKPFDVVNARSEGFNVQLFLLLPLVLTVPWWFFIIFPTNVDWVVRSSLGDDASSMKATLSTDTVRLTKLDTASFQGTVALIDDACVDAYFFCN